MSFRNVRRILGLGPTLSAYKLLLMAAGYSRPRLRGISSWLLRPFVDDGKVAIHYRCYGRRYTAFIDMAEEASDYTSVMELAVRCVYHVDPAFKPELVLDGGGNIGMFTLYAAAVYPTAKIVVCEPVPRNLERIREHLGINRVSAEVRPICIGGSRRTIPFYVREANQSSFMADRPYASQKNLEVIPLGELVRDTSAQRILIKLDIEGMEMEALESYIPGEKRAVCIVGELHDHKHNGPAMERMFKTNGWVVRFDDVSDVGSMFEAWSPASIEPAEEA